MRAARIVVVRVVVVRVVCVAHCRREPVAAVRGRCGGVSSAYPWIILYTYTISGSYWRHRSMSDGVGVGVGTTRARARGGGGGGGGGGANDFASLDGGVRSTRGHDRSIDGVREGLINRRVRTDG